MSNELCLINNFFINIKDINLPIINNENFYFSNEQKNIIEDDSRIKLINGCAGSRKTDTIIKNGIKNLIKKKQNILFVTFVSSVTDEIKTRIEKILNINIPRIYNSNHYIANYNDNFIEIANFDAWVYKQLDYIHKEFGNINGDTLTNNFNSNCDFNKRILDLIDISKKNNFYNIVLKNNSFADLIVIDEFQDVDINKVELVKLYLNNNLNLNCILAGDLLQTIFINNFYYNNSFNPIINFNLTMNPTYFEISTCYRCPKPHIDLVNYLLGNYYEKFNLKNLKSYYENKDNSIKTSNKVDTELGTNLHKPVLFMHDCMSNNIKAHSIAKSVCNTIIAILENDKEIKLGDVAIIMKKSNNNYIFEQIKNIFPSIYIKYYTAYDENNIQNNNLNDLLCHFETNADGYRYSIDWNKAVNKTILLSIHGDKGKGHKVVFFLGLSKKSIPDDNNLYKEIELGDISLLNVALTRSEKYLFIGFTENNPSIYLSNKYEHLDKYCYLSWNKKTWKNIKPYEDIISKLNKHWYDNLPKNRKYPKLNFKSRNNILLAPFKGVLKVYDDISKDFSNKINDIIGKYEIKEEAIDIYENIDFINYNEVIYNTFGFIGEILIFRKINNNFNTNFKEFLIFISNNYFTKNILFTDNNEFLNIIFDNKINNNFNNFNDWYEKILDINLDFSSSNFDELLSINNILNNSSSPIIILNKYFYNNNLFDDINKYLSNTTNAEFCSDLKTIWNITILYIEFNNNLRKNILYTQLDNFKNNINSHKIINQIVTNVDFIINNYINNNYDNFEFQKNLAIYNNINSKDDLIKLGFNIDYDRRIFKNGFNYGIIGIADIINLKIKSIFEIKTCLKTNFSNEWLLQVYLYTLLTYKNYNILCNDIYIMNIYKGTIYKINFEINECEIDNSLKYILKLYNFNDDMINNLLKI
jgi:hypothetical protein